MAKTPPTREAAEIVTAAQDLIDWVLEHQSLFRNAAQTLDALREIEGRAYDLRCASEAE